MVRVLLVAVAATTSVVAGQPPEELGRINWLRNYERARTQARATRRPLMVLFDEVPGCATCKRFGAGPLSHPIIVSAADAFVPVAIYNNRPGYDRQRPDVFATALRAAKSALDPKSILNPGVLIDV